MVRLLTGWSNELLARVRSGSLDAAVVLLFDRDSPPSGVEAQQLAREHLDVVVPRHWPSRRCRPRDLQRVEWILNPDGCAARAELRRALARLELPLRVSVETYNYELQLRLIARGRGVGLVPSRLRLRSAVRPKLRVLRVTDLGVRWASGWLAEIFRLPWNPCCRRSGRRSFDGWRPRNVCPAKI